MHRLTCALVVAVAACGGSPKAAQQTMVTSNTSAASGASCEQASDHVLDVLAKGKPDAPPDLIKKIRETLVKHCQKDEWSAASRSCFANLSAEQDANKCEDSLSDAQKKALDSESIGDEGGDMKAPPPPPDGGKPGGGTRGGPRKGGDPCDGGE